MILILSLLTMVIAPVSAHEDIPATWDSDLHQFVVVKATALMPQGLQRQILKHRSETLSGCLDVLREGYSITGAEQELKDSFELLVKYLGSKTPFSKTCYQMGKISTLISEYSSPVRGTTIDQEINRFKRLVSIETDGFPLVINQQGEGFIKERDLGGYLSFQYIRNVTRRDRIASELSKSSNQNSWRNQKSVVYGLASLCYNDMVIDTARIWLMAWELAGGSSAEAPYFYLNQQVNK